MRYFILEPLLVNYSGHFYNFTKEIHNSLIIDYFKKSVILGNIKCRNTGVIPYFINPPRIRCLRKFVLLVALTIQLVDLRVNSKKDDVFFVSTADNTVLLVLSLLILPTKRIYYYFHNIKNTVNNLNNDILIRFLMCIAHNVKHKLIIKNCTFFVPYLQSSRGINFLYKTVNAPYPLKQSHDYFFVKKVRTYHDLPIVSFLGSCDRRKGFIDFASFMDSYTSEYQYHVQINNFSKDEEIMNCIKKIQILSFKKLNVKVINGNLSPEKYLNEIINADILMLLYDSKFYENGFSGVLLEAILCCTPFIVTKIPWAEKYLAKHDLNLIVDDLKPGTVNNKVRYVLANFSTICKKIGCLKDDLMSYNNAKELIKLIIK